MGGQLIDISIEVAADEWISTAPLETRNAEYWAFLAGVAWGSNRWTSPTESLPEDGERVLVQHYHQGVVLAYYWGTLEKWIIDGGVYDFNSVTQWAPVALPPRLEKAGEK